MTLRSFVPVVLLLIGCGSAVASDKPGAGELFRKLDLNGDRSIQFCGNLSRLRTAVRPT